MNKQFYDDLELIRRDDDQWRAFQSMRNTVVIAGPGSGKTRVLALKAVALAKTEINPPAGLVCISYSRETVRELKKRLKLYGYIPGTNDFIGTIHSFSLLHVLRPFAHLYQQYKIPYPIKVLPDDVEQQIYKSTLEVFKQDEWTLKLGEIKRYRSLMIEGRSAINKPSTNLVREAAIYFENELKKTPYLDFISIINFSAKIISEQEYVRKTLKCKFPWLLVDEYQDLGKALHEMVTELFFNADIKIYAVGDVHQSIYGFNGGYPDFLEELMKNDDIFSVVLQSNYRSTQPVIEASLETLDLKQQRPAYRAQRRIDEAADFTFIACREEMEPQYEVTAKYVVPNLLSKGLTYNDIAVIVGSNAQVKAMSKYFKKHGIPFYLAKWDFENSNVVVWLQDCASWCTDPTNNSFDQLFRTWYGLLRRHNDPRVLDERIKAKVELHRLLTSAREKKLLLDWLIFIIDGLSIKATLQNSEEFPDENDNLDKLINEANLHNLKGADLKRFARLGSPENEVTITTRHSAKGLEFEGVILLGMEEGKFPFYSIVGDPILLAEAQRLCYVCVSRAKKVVVLIRSENYWVGSRNPWYKPHVESRFWKSLYLRFGNKGNTFTGTSYAKIGSSE